MSKSKVIRYARTADKRAVRNRLKIKESGAKYRLSVLKSNAYIYAQIIDLDSGKCIAGIRGKKAEEVGAAIAKKALGQKVKAVVFDRGPYNYHGKVKMLAESARAEGLKF